MTYIYCSFSGGDRRDKTEGAKILGYTVDYFVIKTLQATGYSVVSGELVYIYDFGSLKYWNDFGSQQLTLVVNK